MTNEFQNIFIQTLNYEMTVRMCSTEVPNLWITFGLHGIIILIFYMQFETGGWVGGFLTASAEQKFLICGFNQNCL